MEKQGVAKQNSSITIDNIPIQIQKNARSKRIKLRITSKKEVIMSVPFFYKKEYVFEFAKCNLEWIKSNLNKIPTPKSDEIWILGVKFKLKFDDKIYINFENLSSNISKNSSNLKSNFDEIIKLCEILQPNLTKKLIKYKSAIINLESLLNLPNNSLTIKNSQILDEFLRAILLKRALEYIIKFRPQISHPINHITIKQMTTRWGSCNSKKGYINLNLSLVHLKKELIEYVILHEMTHLIFPHHQKSFYEFLGGIMGDFRQRELGLKGKFIR